jgi:hypothetical protein
MMKTRFRPVWIAICLLAAACAADAQTAPGLSLSLFAPGLAQISWPGSFTDWQLVSATNLGPDASWQVVPGTPLPLGGSLVMFYSLTNASAFFRLQQTGGGGGCVFHATPATISPGDSSTLSWCAVAGTSYQLLPGPGPVTGTNYVVSPAVTTVYTLIASNLAGVVTSNSTTVSVATGNCDFVNATGWDCTLSFTYSATSSSASFLFAINQQANLTFHLSRTALNGNLSIYTGTLGGTAQVTDSETTVASPPPLTVAGSGVPLAGQPANLTIDCGSGTYTFDVQPVISATWSPGGAMDTRVGSVYVNNRALPLAHGLITSTETLPARGPFWSGAGDWYFPGGLGPNMFYGGQVTDTTAGTAAVSWTFAPTP